ncbi:COG4315 family predicted lipoprotein [Plasticicumulans acidivorans]|uniref:Putative lipoprotein with Yx(FWY)xxD motif n=1 Tax=Plasticicumulans acidivorans TaxID=886464 RepID=A0A317MS09_9GAMM|nr:hypothetical protein [Plasticicumulans acidivorans]PWV59824.1 putative lipoprotein with Yx(FWY)xxD motif [Plasticicumulans acidivorans]
MRAHPIAFVAALGFAMTACAGTPGAGMLTSADGRTLYTFDQDTDGSSHCQQAPCSTNWPPYSVEAGAPQPAGLTMIKRDDGSQQWALGGKPLYFFAGDRKPGDAFGDGLKGVWHVARKASSGGYSY